MRNRQCHEALARCTEEASVALAGETAAGAEVPFDLVESRGSRSSLYCYRPLTDDFVRQRMGTLTRLPAGGAAVTSLASLGGVEDYLRRRGERRIPASPHERAEAALRVFLCTVFEDSSDFELSRDRFSECFAELEACVYRERTVTQVLAPVPGLAIESAEVPMADGLALVRGDSIPDAPVEAIWAGRGEEELPNVLALFTCERRVDDDEAGGELADAKERLRALVRALRLYDVGSFTHAAVAWTRQDGGPWQIVTLGGSGRASGPVCSVSAGQEDELRGFCNLVARRGGGSGELAWALGRFEMACDRADPLEGLTDLLLAGRALLEPEGPSSGKLAQRLAAICAIESERAALAERVAHAISLERAVVAGLAPQDDRAAALAGEVSHHIRLVLRDVVCGHLDSDLVRVADELLEDSITLS